MLQRIDGPAPLTAPPAAEGVGVSAQSRDVQPPLVGSDSPAQPSADDLRAAVASANRMIQAFSQSLEFEVDPDTEKIVIKVVDTEDRRVLRQVPSQEMIAIARALERMQTLLVRSKA